MARAKKASILCARCVIVRDQPIMTPTHLVHPMTGDLMPFDVRGEAVCPTCGARYRRTLNVIALVE
jgi:uncharacterized Zn-finger protein